MLCNFPRSYILLSSSVNVLFALHGVQLVSLIVLVTRLKTGLSLVMAHMLGILYRQDVNRVPHKCRYLGIDTLVHLPVVKKCLDLSIVC
jgi:hypothetical protein